MCQKAGINIMRVKAAVTMPQVIERYGVGSDFRQLGNTLVGCCPIHRGKNPFEFRVNLTTNCWTCLTGCKNGGNVLEFVSQMEGITLRGATQKLSKWFNLPMEQLFEWTH